MSILSILLTLESGCHTVILSQATALKHALEDGCSKTYRWHAWCCWCMRCIRHTCRCRRAWVHHWRLWHPTGVVSPSSPVTRCVDGDDYKPVDVVAPLLRCWWRIMQAQGVVKECVCDPNVPSRPTASACHGRRGSERLLMHDSCSGHHSHGGVAGVRPVGLPHHRTGSNLLLTPWPWREGQEEHAVDWMFTIIAKPEHREQNAPFLTRQMSKWFTRLSPAPLLERPTVVRC
jgi:hypothetical protein